MSATNAHERLDQRLNSTSQLGPEATSQSLRETHTADAQALTITVIAEGLAHCPRELASEPLGLTL